MFLQNLGQAYHMARPHWSPSITTSNCQRITGSVKQQVGNLQGIMGY